MDAQKEAKELVFGFYKIVGLDGFSYDCDPIDVIDNGLHKIAQLSSKECALRCVGKIISCLGNTFNFVNENGDIIGSITESEHWEEVRQAIENLYSK